MTLLGQFAASIIRIVHVLSQSSSYLVKVTNFIASTENQTIESYNPSSHLAQLKHRLLLPLSLPLAHSPEKKREIDFCLEFVKSGAVVPVNGAPRRAG